MMLTTAQIKQLLDAATEAAQQAAEYIQQFDRDALVVDQKVAGNSLSSQVVTQVDIDCQTLILSVLEPYSSQYGFAVLSEENALEEQAYDHPRHQADYFWCIDPLDGTLPFIEGIDGFAISIALVSKAGDPLLGVVANPNTCDCYQAYCCEGKASLLKNGLPWVSQPKPTESGLGSTYLTFFVDRSFLNDPRFKLLEQKLATYAHERGFEGVRVFSRFGAVMNAIGTLELAPACYLKLPKAGKGGGSLWDFSATAAIFSAALCQATGYSVSDIFGDPLDLNRSDSNFMNHKGVAYTSGLASEEVLQLCQLVATE
ncbi:inositol-1-monophosphatase [Photobacterium sanctipauli]|uniref:Inositol-1-monophosphatase n=1 Tax=Photobacterium sanctipauli TaxID=1342794 RepID=A0A2T3P104_9GAMM|nr:inositol monophosphatase family protein [Photobacterium sanctipauli]PSW22187.1 inositol-1-monophosphatase [Photobacterium sanctipauli]